MLIRADLHMHTVLSPCGDLDMSPANIIRIARQKGLDMIGITDHNSTRQASIIRDLGKEHGIQVLTGVEITTQEEMSFSNTSTFTYLLFPTIQTNLVIK